MRIVQEGFGETGSTRGRLARGLVQVRHAAAAAATAKVLPHLDRRAVRAKALDVIARIENALMLAAAADGGELSYSTEPDVAVVSRHSSMCSRE
jgi:hypothetical protein